MFKRIIFAIFVVCVFYLTGCSDDSTSPPQNGNLTLNISGLENLGSNAIYEGWIMVNGNPLSTGTFSINLNGQLSKSVFEVNLSNLNSASAFILTIEPVPDPNSSPSNNKIIAGGFSGNIANLSIGHQSALGNDFSSASGNYVLATPTDGENNNELSGVWFLRLPMPPQQGLQLPALPTGWEYEGWVILPGTTTPLTTGKFLSPLGSDQNAPYSGSLPGPPFPGEDLLVNAPSGFTFPTNLQGGKIVITVEPSPDNSAAPFSLKPLSADVAPNAMDHTNYNLTNQSASNPRGTATR